MLATVHAAGDRAQNRNALSPPPHFRPPRELVCGSGDEEPEDAKYEQYMRCMEDAETADGCDWPEGPISPTGCTMVTKKSG